VIRRRTISLWLASVACLLWAVGSGTNPTRADEASDKAALQAQLDALLREIGREEKDVNPFEEGEVPDAMVIATSEILGEVAPCG
jgi:hypothetical protein